MAPVDDFGLEVLKKVSESVTAGDVSNHYLKVLNGWLFQKLGRKVDVTYPSSSTEVYTFKQGSTAVFAITVTYTDSTKENVLSAERTT